MKTFNDLIFTTEEFRGLGKKSRSHLNFENNYGVSVINGFGAYCDSNTFELAVLYNDDLCYNTELTDDVLTYQTIADINKVMEYLQKLK